MKKKCKHKWRYYDLHDHWHYKCFLERECKKCGLKQSRKYLGGDMWEWKNE